VEALVEKTEVMLKEKPVPVHVYHKSHIDWLGLETRPPQQKIND
jgi:hypothetical protein